MKRVALAADKGTNTVEFIHQDLSDILQTPERDRALVLASNFTGDMIMLNTLRQVQLFANLSDEQLHCLSQQGSEVWLNRGDFLFVEGEPAENFDVLLEGEFELVKRVNEKEIVLTNYQSGTFTGEIPLLASTPHLVSARALCKSQLLRFRADTFDKMLLKCFPMTRAILCTMAGLFNTTWKVR